MSEEASIPASRIIRGVLFSLASFALPLFVPAGTLRWWRGWVLIGVIFIATLLSLAGLSHGHQDLLKERMKPIIQKGQPLADKIVLLIFILAYYGLLVFIPLDVFHFHLLPRPGALVSSAGLLLFITGWWIIYLTMKENAFAAPVVKHQQERQHRVVDTGVYRTVRHPMYAGFILFMVGVGLWLESYAGAMLSAVPLGVLVIRILIEERFLRSRLEGYDAYTKKVRYRLIPLVW